jgi:molybdate transport system substrate-binding protein
MLRALIVVIAIAGCGKKDAGPNAPIKVAAASDLAFAFKEVGAAFTKKTGKQVTFTFGSTGNLAKQISEGAPYDVLAAANVSFVDDVVKAGACDGATKAMYARGRIVVWRKGPATELAALTDAAFVKIAIANPEHAPYGKAAKQALVSLGIWDRVQPKIVYGENILQTLQFAQTGNVEASIVALSLAKVSDDGHYTMVDDKLHEPIDQALVVCKHGTNAQVAKDFAAFVSSEEGRTIMRKFGFLLPGESA